MGVLTREEAARLIVPKRTLAHRKRRREHLSPDESDRLARVLHLHKVALQTFDEDADKVSRWLRTPNRALSGEIPLDLIVTSGGARLAEDVLLRLEHGRVAELGTEIADAYEGLDPILVAPLKSASR